MIIADIADNVDTHIELKPAEILLGAIAGVARVIKGQRELNDQYGAKRDWNIDIEGCLGEMALAKCLGEYWHGVQVVGGDDVGAGLEVRMTTHDKGCLILHDKDYDDRRYYLVTGSLGKYVVRGYVFGVDGKKPKYWSDPTGKRPAYFVPQSDLIRVKG
jgi:hypothetical protein